MGAIQNDWLQPLTPEFKKPYYAALYKKIREEYSTRQIFPPADEIFTAFELTPLSEVKVVIIGQDPYHGVNQAHGLCFSVKKGVMAPPSLKNIFIELKDDLGCEIPSHGELVKWAKEGVLMLNTVLTVREGQANSHANKGWEKLTDRIISILNENPQPLVFLLWGRNAQSKTSLITNEHHLILKCAHPSPLSAYNGFFGCRHFSKANRFLIEHGRQPIDWQIED